MATMGSPGWHPNPTNSSEERYWDGTTWTSETRPRQPAHKNPAPTSPANDLVATVFGFAIMIGIVVAVVWGIVAAVRGNVDDHDAAVALNKHINGMGQDFAGYSNYKGTQPDGGKGAVAIETSLYDKAENEQYAEYMCSSLAFTRADIPEVKHVRVLSSSDTTLADCF